MAWQNQRYQQCIPKTFKKGESSMYWNRASLSTSLAHMIFSSRENSTELLLTKEQMQMMRNYGVIQGSRYCFSLRTDCVLFIFVFPWGRGTMASID